MNMNYVWPLWAAMIALTFGVLEGYAVMTDKMTLSRFVWELSDAWRPFQYFAGFLTGFLVCHFWWGGSVSFAPVGRAIGDLIGH